MFMTGVSKVVIRRELLRNLESGYILFKLQIMFKRPENIEGDLSREAMITVRYAV